MQPSYNAYLLVINGKPEGPFSIEELREKRLRPADFVKTPDMDDYKEAHEIAELRQLFNFQQRMVEPQYFAGLDQRLLASALDWLFIAGVYIIPAFALVLAINDREVRVGIGLSLIALIPVTNFIYHVLMEGSKRQATYGKQILKIKVCDVGGGTIGPGQAFGRNCCKFFSDLSLGVGYMISLFNRKQQCLHDMIAGTIVVKDRLL